MLQRKQTLFLILVLALLIPIYFLDLATFEVIERQGDTQYAAISVIEDNGQVVYPLTILLSLIVGLSVAIISLFKKNLIQMRLCVMLILLIIGFIGIESYVLYKFYDSMKQLTDIVMSPSSKISFGIAAFLPIPAAIFAYMAFKGIARDLFLLRSYNKMR